MAFLSSPVPPQIRSAARTSSDCSNTNSVRCCRAQRASVPVSRRGALRLLASSSVGILFAGSSDLHPKVAMSADSIEKQDLSAGDGPSPQKGQKLFMHYTLTLGGFQDAGGKVVDSSRSRNSLFSYKFDTGAVIKGWDMGVADMKVGGRRRLIIPPELGYGSRGVPPVIPPNSTLYFDIELVRTE